MVSHQRAVEQMWQGLIAPSDARWLAGARALTRAPLHIVAQAVTPRSELDVDDVARIRLYARLAEAAASQDARGGRSPVTGTSRTVSLIAPSNPLARRSSSASGCAEVCIAVDGRIRLALA